MFKREPGHELVRASVPHGIISVVNLAEFAEHITRIGGTPQDVAAAIDPLPCEIVAPDHEIGIAAGLLSSLGRPVGLSLADRFCLALAKRLSLPALTGDRKWASVSEAIGVEIRLIR